ncbi:MAG: hypothetical protein HY684_02155 [Chloroflexi bacterium]|nr:hypothetical protein [Chloroflexota bacterium]
MASSPAKGRRTPLEGSWREVVEKLFQMGWSDGLPVVPPVDEAVREMVEYAGRDGGEVVGAVAPAYGEATVERIAANAVMAGCKPEYLPVVIAAVEAMCESRFNLDGLQTTTNPCTVALIVNGPVRKQIDINCGRNCLGQGWRANATIGRAIRLILLNIGGGAPGPVDKAIHGFPGKYSFCFGEDEENSPWDPLHVERGFQRDQSAVTVVGAHSTVNIGLSSFNTIEPMLLTMANALSYIGSNNVMVGRGEPVLVLTSGHAKLTADVGMSKLDVKRFLFQHAGYLAADLPRPMVRTERLSIIDGVVKPCMKAEDVMVVVAGGPETYHAVFVPTFGDTWQVTKTLRTPARAAG